MVCDRCILSVEQALEAEAISFSDIKLGEVTLAAPISDPNSKALALKLEKLGFELILDKSSIIVNQIKSNLVALYDQAVDENLKISDYLTKAMNYDYSHLSRLFSHEEGQTIEQYNIQLRIEKAKEWLSYPENNISEVAYKLGYVSNAHFSRQFKKIEGVSPSEFKKNPGSRKSLESI